MPVVAEESVVVEQEYVDGESKTDSVQMKEGVVLEIDSHQKGILLTVEEMSAVVNL